MEWILQHISAYGGDPNRIYLVGQSAGAYLGVTALLRQAITEAFWKKTGSLPNFDDLVHIHRSNSRSTLARVCQDDKEQRKKGLLWSASAIRGFIGIAGPYDLVSTKDYFHERGLHKKIMERIFNNNLEHYSPFHILKAFDQIIATNNQRLQTKNEESQLSSTKTVTREDVVKLLPPFWLLHGTADQSVPYNISTMFMELAETQGIQASTQLYEGKTHTDPIVEDLITEACFSNPDDDVEKDQGVDMMLDIVDKVTSSDVNAESYQNSANMEDIEDCDENTINAPEVYEQPCSNLCEHKKRRRETKNWRFNQDPLNYPKSQQRQPSFPKLLLRIAKYVNPF